MKFEDLFKGLPLNPIPDYVPRDQNIPHAPDRTPSLNDYEKRLAVQNALRYFPKEHHEILAPEFAKELANHGHIYMYRFCPPIELTPVDIRQIPSRCTHAAAIIHMILNNLSRAIAQFPQELVTYGGNGQVLSNWAQFWLVMRYLSEMSDEQTLVMYSGHPLGLFPARKDSPRAVLTNGMMVPNYSRREDYEKHFALGVTMYGQMTAGSYCYIGPQGIVHGTTLTLINAGRKYLSSDDLSGKVFLSSGLGGMSGAQAKASVVVGCVGVIAEVSKEALNKRLSQGWLSEKTSDIDELFRKIKQYKSEKKSVSIGFHGNVVTVWEKAVEIFNETGEMPINLGSDQTSLHNPFLGGYYPVQLTYEGSREMMNKNPEKFKSLVEESLRRQVAAINKLSDNGMFFWDYGNAFLLEASRAGGELKNSEDKTGTVFRYPSYVQHIMGDIFSLGFGPFRWVCTSADSADLDQTDSIAVEILEKLLSSEESASVKEQYTDNIKWIKAAKAHKLVVGSQARILYSDQIGRTEIALAFNRAIAKGLIKAPVVLSRDHHDVSGTDSPFRETSNVYDGSVYCADMSVQNVIGDSFRGATWVALHNGGGVGWGEVINGGFGLVLDGSLDAEQRAKLMLSWDVSNGVARRCWSGNENAKNTITKTMERSTSLNVTMPNSVAQDIVDKLKF